MPKLKPDTQKARREHILDSAELCFASLGFHGATMQDICREAGVSPGAVYLYFRSKEDLIAGITERDRAKLADQLADVARAPDLMAGLERVGEHYMVDEPRHKQQLIIEIGCQSMRDGPVGEIFRACDAFVLEQFEALFERARLERKIAPSHDSKTLAQIIAVMGDGLFWRRGIDAKFDAKTLVPIMMGVIRGLLAPVEPGHVPNPSPGRSSARAPAAAKRTPA